MKTIVEGKSNIEKLLGKQKVHNVQYRLMKYLLRTKCEDGELLHNVITGRMVLISNNEVSIIESLPSFSTEEMVSLIESFFLVPVDYNEATTVDKLRVLMKKLFIPKGINDYTVFTSTNCNARCFYCYQSDYPHINMSTPLSDRVSEFMIENKGKGPLRISWFGGEPLIGINCIDHICDRLLNEKVDYLSTMISNGYLFNEEIVERACKKWNLKSVQITLDGMEDVYNATKRYTVSDASPFKRVLNNIRLLLDKDVQVNIRLNLDQHNQDDLNELIDYLLDTFGSFRNLGIYVHVLYENKGFSPIKRDEIACRSLYEAQIKLDRKIIRSGFARKNIPLPHLNLNSCMADNSNAIVIYPDGRLFNCEHIIKEDEVGNVSLSSDELFDNTMFWDTANNDRCHNCPLRPSCLILQKCEGLKDRNDLVCDFDIEMRTLSLLKHYQDYVTRVNQ